MIITKEITISISRGNIGLYRNKGYSDIEIGDTVNILVSGLTKGSHYKIDAKCSFCDGVS